MIIKLDNDGRRLNDRVKCHRLENNASMDENSRTAVSGEATDGR